MRISKKTINIILHCTGVEGGTEESICDGNQAESKCIYGFQISKRRSARYIFQVFIFIFSLHGVFQLLYYLIMRYIYFVPCFAVYNSNASVVWRMAELFWYTWIQNNPKCLNWNSNDSYILFDHLQICFSTSHNHSATLPLYLSIYLSICLHLTLSFFFTLSISFALFLSLSLSLLLSLFSLSLSVSLSISLSLSLSLTLSLSLSLFRSVSLLSGLERCAGEVVTDMLTIIENCEPDEAQMRLVMRGTYRSSPTHILMWYHFLLLKWYQCISILRSRDNDWSRQVTDVFCTICFTVLLLVYKSVYSPSISHPTSISTNCSFLLEILLFLASNPSFSHSISFFHSL